MNKIKINMIVMADSEGCKTTHEMRTVKLEKGNIIYSADDILRMLGYASVYSSKHNHHFVNGLRSRSSRLYRLPHLMVAGTYKFWNEGNINEVYEAFSSLAKNKNSGTSYNIYLDNWWMVVELVARGKSTPVKEVVKPTIPYDWYSEGDLPEVDTECEYSVSGSPFRWCTINYIGGDILVITTKTKKDVVVDLDTLELRPLDLEKKQTVAAMMEHSMAGMSLSDFSAKLFEAGYQLTKQEK